jgi:hypothetical protein
MTFVIDGYNKALQTWSHRAMVRPGPNSVPSALTGTRLVTPKPLVLIKQSVFLKMSNPLMPNATPPAGAFMRGSSITILAFPKREPPNYSYCRVSDEASDPIE